MRLDSIIANTNVEPRPYQARIIEKTTNMFRGLYKRGDGITENPVRSVMIESPTGSGKTVMGLLDCKVMQTHIPDLAIGWVAMRRNLLKQAQAENLAKGINVQDISYISMFDHSPDEIMAMKNSGRPIMLVIDEAQHDAASSMVHLHNLIDPQFTLGLTATPFRTDRIKLCFEKIVKDAGIHNLIQDGYLSQFAHYTIEKWEPEVIAQHYLSDPARWGKSLFFFHELESCFKLQNLFKAAGLISEVVTGDSDRETQLELFRDGRVNLLINCMVLTEGFDEPGLQTAWVRDSGRGTSIQMAGRVLRKFPGLTHKQIVQSKNTRWPFIKTALPVQQWLYQNQSWRSLQVNEYIEDITEAARQAIANIVVELPKFILNKRKKKKAKFGGAQ